MIDSVNVVIDSLSLSKRFKITEKLYASKTFLKMGGERMLIPHLIPLDQLLAISLRNHTYFSHLAPLVLFFFTKRRSQKGRGAWHNVPPPLNTLLVYSFCCTLLFWGIVPVVIFLLPFTGQK